MRKILGFLASVLLAAFIGGAPAHAQIGGIACPPSATTSPDGSISSPLQNCPLKDSGGHVWNFGAFVCGPTSQCWGQQTQALYAVNKDGSPTGFSGIQLYEQGGKTYILTLCDQRTYFTDPNTSNLQIPSPSNPTSLANHVTAQSGTLNYPSLDYIYGNNIFASHFTYTLTAQAGVPFFSDRASVGYGQASVDGVSIIGQQGAAIGCSSGHNGGQIEQYNATSLTVRNLSLGNNHATNSGPNSCVNQITGQENLALIDIFCIRSDVCFFSGGHNGVVTWTRVWAVKCGGDMSTGASTHGCYRGTAAGDDTVFTWSYGGAVATSWDPTKADDVGFQCKDRGPTGTYDHLIFGEPSVSDDGTPTYVAAVLDFPCIGNHTIQHSIIELGPHTAGASGTVPGLADTNAANGFIRVGDDGVGAANCDNQTYATRQTIVTYDIIINDCGALGDTHRCNNTHAPQCGVSWSLGDNDVPVLCLYTALSQTGEVDHSIIVVDPSTGCTDGSTSCPHALGPNVTEGVGNHYFTSRASADAYMVSLGYPAGTIPTDWHRYPTVFL